MPGLTWVTHHRIWALGIGVAVLIAAIAAGVWFFALRSPGTQIDLRQALRLYRQGQSADRSGRGVHLPPSGVYRYRTSGNERLSVGGIGRSFPAATEMIVNEGRCATFRWAPFEQHIEGLVECPLADDALAMMTAMSDEQIAGVHTTEVIHCPADAYFVPPSPADGERWNAMCDAAGQRVAFSGQVIGNPLIDVGGRKLPSLHTRLTLSFSGSESGANPTDYWISVEDGLILRQRETVDMVQQTGPLGSVRYTEQMAIAISSVTPAR
jgi:hypothetical protein